MKHFVADAADACNLARRSRIGHYPSSEHRLSRASRIREEIAAEHGAKPNILKDLLVAVAMHSLGRGSTKLCRSPDLAQFAIRALA
jgi:hypothetical protein